MQALTQTLERTASQMLHTQAQDHRDPMSCFLTFKKLFDDAFLFETTGSFSVVGIPPFKTIAGSNIFKSLETLLALNKTQSKVPFENGGVFGVIDYESVSEIEPKLKAQKQFSGEGASELLFVRKLIVFDHNTQMLHFIDRRPETRPYISDMLAIYKSTKMQPVQVVNLVELDPARLTPIFGAQAFTTAVQKIKEHIKQGDIFQAVLAERFTVQTDVSALEIFTQLRRQSTSPYSYFFKFQNSEFFGASPETLVSLVGNRILSHPIAGTKPRGKTQKEDTQRRRELKSSKKEAAEHLMLLDLARNDVGRVARAGTVKVGQYRKIQNLANVMHLVSEVEGQVRDGISSIGVLKACFPAGTLSGAPKIRAMEILSGLETVPRGFYGGGVVAIDLGGNMESCISIRSCEKRGREAVLRAGAGIVHDSKPEMEYQEISHKLRSMRQAIATAEKGTIS